MNVQFRGPEGTIFTFDPKEGVSVFCGTAEFAVLGGRRGWHQLVPVGDLLAVAEHAKASGWEAPLRAKP